MLNGFFPRITLSGTDTRKGDGIAFVVNGKCMMVDAFDGGEATERMITWFGLVGVTQIDLAVLTHAHGDHYGGFRKIVNAGIKIKEFRCYHPDSIRAGNAASREDSDNLLTLIRWLQARGTRVLFVDHGDVLQFEDISWHIYRNQPEGPAASDDPNAWEYVNNGSLVLHSPELEGMLPGDGPENPKEAIAYFQRKYGKVKILTWFDISHHGGAFSQSNAASAKNAGAKIAYESCVEDGGPGTTDWTKYGARRVVQQDIPVLMQDQNIYINASKGKISFTQGGNKLAYDIPYEATRNGWAMESGKWVYYKDGVKLRGWHFLAWSGGTHWFRFDDYGNMQTGWIFVDHCWYYLSPETGAMQTGWMDWKGKRCYLEPVSGKNQGHCYIDCTAVIDGKTYMFDREGYATEVSEATTSTLKPGDKVIDVSEFQPENIDWDKVKAGGYAVIPRIGLRGSVPHTDRYRKVSYDYHFKKYIDGILRAGIPYSVYFFPTPLSDTEADTEAEWIITNVDGLQLSMPVFLDSEKVSGGVANGISTADRTRYLKRITDKLVDAGIPCGIYASTSWLQNQINMEQLQQQVRDNTWVAQYNTVCTYDGIYAMWQYSSRASVAGISGNVDISEVKRSFNMSCQKPQTDPVDAMIEIMEGEIGYHEKASAASLDSKTANSGSNNYTKYGKELHALQPRNMDYPAAWCDAFFDWCVLQLCKRYGFSAEMAREVLCGDFDDYTYSSVNLYKKAGRWTQTPARGYQIFFGGSGHTGGVTKVEGGYVYTIEGNKSDQVKACRYKIGDSSIIGYGMPRYELLTGGTYTVKASDMPLIKQGSSGSAVLRLQQILNSQGANLEEDGDFGPKTLAAVKAFQKARGLEIDGEVGPLTWAALIESTK